MEEIYGEEALMEAYGEELYGEEMEELYGDEEASSPIEVNINLELVLPENTDSQALMNSLNGATVSSEETADGLNY